MSRIPLFVLDLPESKRPEPEQRWRAAVRYGPVVHHKNRRTAVRRAVQGWLEDCEHRPIGNLAVNVALRTEIEIRPLETELAFRLLHEGRERDGISTGTVGRRR